MNALTRAMQALRLALGNLNRSPRSPKARKAYRKAYGRHQKAWRTRKRT